jgi:hypothetical protein
MAKKKPVVPMHKTLKAKATQSGMRAPKMSKEARDSHDKRLVLLRDGTPMRRINMLFPQELALRLRRYCADKDTNMTEASLEALDTFLRAAGY